MRVHYLYRRQCVVRADKRKADMSTLRVHLDEQTRDFIFRNSLRESDFDKYRTPIHPVVLEALVARHKVTDEDELLFDEDTLGLGFGRDDSSNAHQRWDASVETLWQVNELRGPSLQRLLPMTPYDEGGQQMYQSLFHNDSVDGAIVYYWVATDGEASALVVTRIEMLDLVV